MASFFSSDQPFTPKPTQLTLIPQRHLERFHDLQSNRRTNEYGTRRIRYYWRAKAKATPKTSITYPMVLQGLEGTLLSIWPTRQQSPPPAVFSEAAWLCTSLNLGGGRNGSPARYVLLRTQSPLPPSSAQTLLTLVPHRLHSSAPFVIILPLFRFSAATTRPSFHSGFQRSHFAPKNCTTTTNHIRLTPALYHHQSFQRYQRLSD